MQGAPHRRHRTSTRLPSHAHETRRKAYGQAPADTHGARVTQTTIHSEAVGRDLDVGVVLPPGIDESERRPLLIFLHGKGESVDTYREDEAFFAALAKLGRRAPIVAFPEDDGDSYWHDRESGGWETYVIDEAIREVAHRFGADPRRVAIGGISMGGFGALAGSRRHRTRRLRRCRRLRSQRRARFYADALAKCR